MLRFLVDECLGRGFVERLREAGHDVAWVKEVCANASDVEVLARAVAEGRVLLTDDYDFGELAFRRRVPAVGIVIVAGAEFAGPVDARNALIVAAIDRLGAELRGFLTVIEPDRARQRRLERPAGGPA